MDMVRKRKLEHYMMNSRKFIWGLGRRNQKQNYAWLQSKGYSFTPGSYTHVTAQLLESPGIEKFMAQVIIPRVKDLFTEQPLSYLRTCWESGTTPDLAVLKRFGLHTSLAAEPFVEINSQYNYVVGWGELAGVWFEEIEQN